MPDPRRVAIRTSADVTRWRWALTPLAIPRLASLNDLAGVPSQMVAKPDRLVEITGRSLIDIDLVDLSRDPDLPLADRVDWARKRLIIWQDDLADVYGASTSAALVLWMGWQFVDVVEAERWTRWSYFFLTIRRGTAVSGLDADTASLVRSHVESWLSESYRLDLELRADAARHAPVTPDELLLLAPYRDNDDESEVDFVSEMVSAADRERARLVYQDLATALPGIGQRALVQAATRWNREATDGSVNDPW